MDPAIAEVMENLLLFRELGLLEISDDSFDEQGYLLERVRIRPRGGDSLEMLEKAAAVDVPTMEAARKRVQERMAR